MDSGLAQHTDPVTILVVEDEPDLATAIAQRIAAKGWRARVASDGASAVRAARTIKPDLVIMDIMLPIMDGITATRHIVEERPVPVLMLTARDGEADKINGLNAGADDYMTKPFSPRELIARCEALLRRVKRASIIAQNNAHEQVLDFGSLVINPGERTVTLNGEPIHLTPTEFDLLVTLARKPKTVFKRDELLKSIWNWYDSSTTRTVDSHVKALRHKIGTARIRTTHGVGYAFIPPDDGEDDSSWMHQTGGSGDGETAKEGGALPDSRTMPNGTIPSYDTPGF